MASKFDIYVYFRNYVTSFAEEGSTMMEARRDPSGKIKYVLKPGVSAEYAKTIRLLEEIDNKKLEELGTFTPEEIIEARTVMGEVFRDYRRGRSDDELSDMFKAEMVAPTAKGVDNPFTSVHTKAIRGILVRKYFGDRLGVGLTPQEFTKRYRQFKLHLERLSKVNDIFHAACLNDKGYHKYLESESINTKGDRKITKALNKGKKHIEKVEKRLVHKDSFKNFFTTNKMVRIVEGWDPIPDEYMKNAVDSLLAAFEKLEKTAPTTAPVTPTTGPATPTTGPVTPTVVSVPTVGPVYDIVVDPDAHPATPTTGPVTPTTAPVTPTTGPATPTTSPVTPTSSPATPTTGPATPTTGPATPTGPVTPTTGPAATAPATPTPATHPIPSDARTFVIPAADGRYEVIPYAIDPDTNEIVRIEAAPTFKNEGDLTIEERAQVELGIAHIEYEVMDGEGNISKEKVPFVIDPKVINANLDPSKDEKPAIAKLLEDYSFEYDYAKIKGLIMPKGQTYISAAYDLAYNAQGSPEQIEYENIRRKRYVDMYHRYMAGEDYSLEDSVKSVVKNAGSYAQFSTDEGRSFDNEPTAMFAYYYHVREGNRHTAVVVPDDERKPEEWKKPKIAYLSCDEKGENVTYVEYIEKDGHFFVSEVKKASETGMKISLNKKQIEEIHTTMESGRLKLAGEMETVSFVSGGIIDGKETYQPYSEFKVSSTYIASTILGKEFEEFRKGKDLSIVDARREFLRGADITPEEAKQRQELVEDYRAYILDPERVEQAEKEVKKHKKLFKAFEDTHPEITNEQMLIYAFLNQRSAEIALENAVESHKKTKNKFEVLMFDDSAYINGSGVLGLLDQKFTYVGECVVGIDKDGNPQYRRYYESSKAPGLMIIGNSPIVDKTFGSETLELRTKMGLLSLLSPSSKKEIEYVSIPSESGKGFIALDEYIQQKPENGKKFLMSQAYQDRFLDYVSENPGKTFEELVTGFNAEFIPFTKAEEQAIREKEARAIQESNPTYTPEEVAAAVESRFQGYVESKRSKIDEIYAEYEEYAQQKKDGEIDKKVDESINFVDFTTFKKEHGYTDDKLAKFIYVLTRTDQFAVEPTISAPETLEMGDEEVPVVTTPEGVATPIVATTPEAVATTPIVATTPEAVATTPIVATTPETAPTTPIVATTPEAVATTPIVATTPEAVATTPIVATTPETAPTTPIVATTPEAVATTPISGDLGINDTYLDAIREDEEEELEIMGSPGETVLDPPKPGEPIEERGPSKVEMPTGIYDLAADALWDDIYKTLSTGKMIQDGQPVIGSVVMDILRVASNREPLESESKRRERIKEILIQTYSNHALKTILEDKGLTGPDGNPTEFYAEVVALGVDIEKCKISGKVNPRLLARAVAEAKYNTIDATKTTDRGWCRLALRELSKEKYNGYAIDENGNVQQDGRRDSKFYRALVESKIVFNTDKYHELIREEIEKQIDPVELTSPEAETVELETPIGTLEAVQMEINGVVVYVDKSKTPPQVIESNQIEQNLPEGQVPLVDLDKIVEKVSNERSSNTTYSKSEARGKDDSGILGADR